MRWQLGGLVKGGLFCRWEHSTDGRQWSFHIRNGAQFHDGQACTAGHIIDFIEAILDSRDTFGMKRSYHRYLAHAKFTVQSVGAVHVENPEPIADILDIFTEFFICRVALNGQPVLGTGPYCVVEFDKEKGRAILASVQSKTSTAQVRHTSLRQPSQVQKKD